MSALEDVEKSLNAIRRISRDANSPAQYKILELILQTSISNLKALAVALELTSSDSTLSLRTIGRLCDKIALDSQKCNSPQPALKFV